MGRPHGIAPGTRGRGAVERATAASRRWVVCAALSVCACRRAEAPPRSTRARPLGPIARENARVGGDGWRLSRASERGEVEGYASATSVVAGQRFEVRVNASAARAVRWEAWRVGHYQGRGGRLIAQGGPRLVSPQPACPLDVATGMIECRWAVAFTLEPDAAWVTGAYLIKLLRDDGYASYVPVIVREAAPRAPILFQASVNTWQAYNDWGGASLYVNRRRADGFTGRRGYRVSFDRPYSNSGCCSSNGSGQLLWWEAPMARWLESRGYEVSYVTNVDVDADARLALRPRVFLSVGHDEYWTSFERAALDRAADAGTSLAFFSADTGTYRALYGPSSGGAPRRQITCYKDEDQARDPQRGTDLQTSHFALAPLDRPENALLGVMYAQWSGGARAPMVVADPAHWIFAGTGVARGETLAAVVGSEWDRVHDNGRTPRGLEVVTASPGLGTEGLNDVSNATVHYPTATSVVFAAGTLSWAKALTPEGAPDPRIERMTENILARAGVAADAFTAVPRASPPRRVGDARAVSLVAGDGAAGYLDGPAGAARFDAPAGVAAARDGTLYVTDSHNHRVRAVAPDGRVTTLAGCGPTGALRSERFRDGAGATACFDAPTGVAVGPDGTVYVSDTFNHRVRAITPAGVVRTYAGGAEAGDRDARDPLAATFTFPRGLAFGRDGALYVADSGTGSVRRVARDGVRAVARGLEGPMGLASAPDGRLFVTLSDGTLGALDGGALTVLAGAPFSFDDVDGAGREARLRPGDGVAVLGQRVLFADSNNHRVRALSLAGGHRVTTLAGTGRVGRSLGDGATAETVLPRGLTPFREGVAVADSANHRVLYVLP